MSTPGRDLLILLLRLFFSGYDILRLNEAAIVRLWLVEKAKNPKQEDDWNWDSDQPEQ